MIIKDDVLYVGYLSGANSNLDSFNLSLGSQSSLFTAADSMLIVSIAVSDDGTIFLIRKDAAGTTRELRYWDGASWDTITSFFGNLPSIVKVQGAKLYVSFVDDTITGDSQAAIYVYDLHGNYIERMGTPFLSTSTKNKSWDITTRVAGGATIFLGVILFEIDDVFIYITDGVTDASYPSGFQLIIKKFRR